MGTGAAASGLVALGTKGCVVLSLFSDGDMWPPPPSSPAPGDGAEVPLPCAGEARVGTTMGASF